MQETRITLLDFDKLYPYLVILEVKVSHYMSGQALKASGGSGSQNVVRLQPYAPTAFTNFC